MRGRCVLVTGGARRLGRAVCERLAEAGAHVAVHFHRSGEEAGQLCERLGALGVRVCAVQADLSHEEALRDLVAQARHGLGGLDGLVNNAAVFGRDSLHTLEAPGLLEHWRVNVMAPLLLTRYFAEPGTGGSVVNMLDQRTMHPDRSHVSYWISKTALEQATRLLALELAPAYTVNAVSPGAVLAPPRKGGLAPELAGPMPLGRRPALREVAGAVVYLLGHASITGDVLRVDGGQHLVPAVADTPP